MGGSPDHSGGRMGRHRDRDDPRGRHQAPRPRQCPNADLRRDLLREGRVVSPHAGVRRNMGQGRRRSIRRRRRLRPIHGGRIPGAPAHRQVADRAGYEDFRSGRPRRLAHRRRHLRHHHRLPSVPTRPESLPHASTDAPGRPLPGDRRHGDRHEPHIHPRRLPHNVRPGRVPMRRQGPGSIPAAPAGQATRMGRPGRAEAGVVRPAHLPHPPGPTPLHDRPECGQPSLAARSGSPGGALLLRQVVGHLRSRLPRPVCGHSSSWFPQRS